jgi:hypothetical protein
MPNQVGKPAHLFLEPDYVGYVGSVYAGQIINAEVSSGAAHRTHRPAVGICVRCSPDSRHKADRLGRIRLVPAADQCKCSSD